MLLLIPFGIMLSYVFQYIFKNNKYHSLIISCLAVILFSFVSINLFYSKNLIQNLNTSEDFLLKQKQENYIWDKITRFYYLNNKTAVLPKKFIFGEIPYKNNMDDITNCFYERNQFNVN